MHTVQIWSVFFKATDRIRFLTQIKYKGNIFFFYLLHPLLSDKDRLMVGSWLVTCWLATEKGVFGLIGCLKEKFL